MRRASEWLGEEARRKVGEAVAEAESRTSAEIVPAAATASGRYDRPEDIVGVWAAVACMVAAWLLIPVRVETSGSWGGWPPWLEAFALGAAVVLGFLGGASLGSRVGWLRRLFTPRAQMAAEVEARARQVFFDSRVHRTASGTGLLFYVSLFERMATVLADREVTEKIGAEAVSELCAKLTERLASGDPADALCEVIREAGERLGAALPREPGDVNELPDALVILD